MYAFENGIRKAAHNSKTHTNVLNAPGFNGDIHTSENTKTYTSICAGKTKA